MAWGHMIKAMSALPSMKFARRSGQLLILFTV